LQLAVLPQLREAVLRFAVGGLVTAFVDREPEPESQSPSSFALRNFSSSELIRVSFFRLPAFQTGYFWLRRSSWYLNVNPNTCH
jgi:hypothetical protein